MIKSKSKLIIYDIAQLKPLDNFILESSVDIVDYSYNKKTRKLFILSSQNIVYVISLDLSESRFELDSAVRYQIEEEAELGSLAVSEDGACFVVSGEDRESEWATNVICVVWIASGDEGGVDRQILKRVVYKDKEYCKIADCDDFEAILVLFQ